MTDNLVVGEVEGVRVLLTVPEPVPWRAPEAVGWEEAPGKGQAERGEQGVGAAAPPVQKKPTAHRLPAGEVAPTPQP